jgi:hypothetical protein
MAKVVTSDGGIQSTEVIVDKKRPVREAAAPLEIQKPQPVAEIGESNATTDGKGEKGSNSVAQASEDVRTASADPNEGIDSDDVAELAKEEYAKERRRVGKYVARLRAQEALAKQKSEEAADSDRLAENLFNERELWRKKAEAAEKEAADLKAKSAPPPAELKEPQPEDAKYKNDKGEFDWLKFSDDRSDYKAKKAIQSYADEQRQAQETVRLEAARVERQKKVDAAVKKHPDWMQVVPNSPITLPQSVLDYIDLSEYGTDIAYFLAKNPDVAGKIRELHPIRAVAEVRDLELSLTKPPEKPVPPGAPSQAAERHGAPAPITPIAASGANPPPLDPAKMDFKQLRAFERERAREMRRR